jgi:hypothetical protein
MTDIYKGLLTRMQLAPEQYANNPYRARTRTPVRAEITLTHIRVPSHDPHEGSVWEPVYNQQAVDTGQHKYKNQYLLEHVFWCTEVWLVKYKPYFDTQLTHAQLRVAALSTTPPPLVSDATAYTKLRSSTHITPTLLDLTLPEVILHLDPLYQRVRNIDGQPFRAPDGQYRWHTKHAHIELLIAAQSRAAA